MSLLGDDLQIATYRAPKARGPAEVATGIYTTGEMGRRILIWTVNELLTKVVVPNVINTE